MPPLMPAAKFRPHESQHHHHAIGHVFAAVIANTLDYRGRAGIAHRKAFARHSVEKNFPAGRAIQNDVANQNVIFGQKACEYAGG